MSELEKQASEHANAQAWTRYWVLGFMASLLLAIAGSAAFESAYVTLVAIGCGLICFIGGIFATSREQRAFQAFNRASGLSDEQSATLYRKFNPQD